MELREIVPGEEITVQPLAEAHPEVEVTVMRLTQAEHQQIWTECGIRTDPKLQTWQQWSKAARKTCLKMVIGWKGFTDKGVELACNETTKPRLLDKMIRNIGPDGEEKRQPLWRLINDQLDKLDEEESKN